jgi:hypothetical protein
MKKVGGIYLSAEGLDRDGMRIFVTDPDGQRHYVMTHRQDNGLFHLLRNRISLTQLYRYKPTRNAREQKLFHSLRYVIKNATWVIENEFRRAVA